MPEHPGSQHLARASGRPAGDTPTGSQSGRLTKRHEGRHFNDGGHLDHYRGLVVSLSRRPPSLIMTIP